MNEGAKGRTPSPPIDVPFSHAPNSHPTQVHTPVDIQPGLVERSPRDALHGLDDIAARSLGMLLEVVGNVQDAVRLWQLDGGTAGVRGVNVQVPSGFTKVKRARMCGCVDQKQSSCKAHPAHLRIDHLDGDGQLPTCEL